MHIRIEQPARRYARGMHPKNFTRRFWTAFIGTATLLALTGCQGMGIGRSVRGQAELRELTGLMAGSFSSAAQAAADEEFFDIRLQTRPIWPERATATEQWLYVEQARGDALDKPYRQRVYRVRSQIGERNKVQLVSEVYELPGDALQFAGWWQTPEKFASLTPEQLKPREGCEVVLARIQPGVYEGSTVGANCLSSLRGATYATSRVHADKTGLFTWDRGYDKDGKQVWGAVKGGYRFLRVE